MDYVCNRCGCCDGSCRCGERFSTIHSSEPQNATPLRGGALPLGVVHPEFLPDRRYAHSDRFDVSTIPLAAVDVGHFGVAMTPRNSDRSDTAIDQLFGYVVVPCLGVLTVLSTLYIIVAVLDLFLWELLEVLRFPIL